MSLQECRNVTKYFVVLNRFSKYFRTDNIITLIMKLYILLFGLLLSSFNLKAQENSIDLDGWTNDYVDCGNYAALNITGTNITLEAWIRPDAFKANVWQGNIINKSGGGDNGYMIRVGNGGQLNFNIGTGWWNEISSPIGALTLNTWAHVAATYDGATMRLYINGAQVAQGPENQNIGSASNNLLLGEDPQFTGRYYPGRIEEVKIWNTTRTPAEIVSDMNDGTCIPYPAGMVAYYRFNQGIATGNNTGGGGLTNVINEVGPDATLLNSSLSGGNSNWHNGRPAFPPADASFNLTAVNCSNATSVITGSTGGSFSFNPAPGDGAIVNAITGEITNGVPGANYTVEYSTCGISNTENVTLPVFGDASFNYAVVCGGANATIIGDAGGVFTWNPAPGDGAQLSATTGNVGTAVATTTYNVQYTVCGTSNTEAVTVLDDNCWTLNGDAQWYNVAGEQCIEMTQETNNQLSCAWNGSQIDFAGDFTLTLEYYFGDNNGNGADGNTFTFQPSASTACGTAGGQMGAGGIPNALVIEFDTYDNDNPTHLYDMTCDHIAVEIDGSMQFAPPLCGPVCAKAGGGNIDDGGTYTVDIQWNSSTNTLDIYFDGVLRLSCSNDFVTNAFGGVSQVYWGATSATGGLNNQQYFCPSTIIVALPVTLGTFSSECIGTEEVISWTTISENNSDYFELDYTYDGFVYYPVETIKAAGNSETELNYSSRITNNDIIQRYYRLKMVDNNGEFEYTDLLSSKTCLNNTTLISNTIQHLNTIMVSTSQETVITFINQLGQVIYSGATDNQYLTINKADLGSGTYYIVAESENGEQESTRIFITQE